MRRLKYIIALAALLTLIFFGMIISVNVLNSDLYGRLIETQSFKLVNSGKEQTSNLPTITLILHKYVGEENSIESSLAINYNRSEVFENFKADTLQFMVRLIDGYSYSPTGLNFTFNFADSLRRNTYGYFYSGFETDRFLIPIAPSLNGFPYDDIQIRPLVDLYVNGQYCELNFQVQKRIPGRILSFSQKDKEIIILTRTSTEKYLVMISSVIFLLLTVLLTYGLVTSKKGLNTVEELVAVAGYILATAGFKEILGINRNNGTSALEILVILIPLLSVSAGLIYSVYKAKRTNNNEEKNSR
ncbi:hypothetical protein P3875_06700 [Myroides sp. JBRI-B21084]|uniref:hypothetical protein n=1 Tax=Myroides sp. JBRI-B21084 TaxID=3119977 RepID=UPI0026E3B61B|nr:hypothetical protein [Paenimyroides cloacae]WKW45475.1 hypothetical protein P3875_06700 [Paenimyroides cloacae]